MNETPKISVIVPVYKVEKYLHKCVDSILNQTYKNLEIILVDDGSPDNCGAICDEYAAKDSRIRVIHKENGGLSSARNAGLDVCTGEYIGFVDSDDWIKPEMYETLYHALEKNSADLAICGFTYVDENGKAIPDGPASPIEDAVLTTEETFAKLFCQNGWFYVTAVNKLYEKHIFDSLRFPEGKLHEDNFTAHHIIDRCAVIATVKDCLYLYLQRSDSIMGRTKLKPSFDQPWAGYDKFLFFRGKGYTKYAKRAWIGIYVWLYTALQQFDYLPNKAGFNSVIRKIMFARADLRTVKIILIVLKKAVMETFGRKRDHHDTTI